ncbi:MAG TPA: MarR family transcriptional regulator, partial [Microbacterium sp.]|nr:MarR family transcriptional regulator [Microbacterium sp.]
TDTGRTAVQTWRAEFRATLAPRFADLDDDEWTVLSRAAEILAAHAAQTISTPASPTQTGESE